MDTVEDDNPFFAAPQHHEQQHHPRDQYDRPFGNSNNKKKSNNRNDHGDHDHDDELVLMAHETFGAAFDPIGDDDDNNNFNKMEACRDIFLTASLEHPDAAAADHWDIMKDSTSALFPEEEDECNHHYDQEPLLEHPSSDYPDDHHPLLASEMSSSGRRQKAVMDYDKYDDEMNHSEEVVPPPLEDVSSQSEKTEEDGDHDDDDDEHDNDEDGEGHHHYQYESETGESYDRFLHALKKFAPREEWPTLQTAVEHRNQSPVAHSRRVQQQQQLIKLDDHPSTPSRDKDKKSKQHLLNTTAQTANTTMTLEDDEHEQQLHYDNHANNVSPRLTAAAVRGAGMAVLHAAKSSNTAHGAGAGATDNNCSHSMTSSISTVLDVAPPAGRGRGGGGGGGTQRHVVVSISSSQPGIQRFNKLSKRLQQKHQQSFNKVAAQQQKTTTTSSRTREPSPKRQTSAKTKTLEPEDALRTTAGGNNKSGFARSISRYSSTATNITTSSMSTPSHPSASSGTTAAPPSLTDATERRSNRGAQAVSANANTCSAAAAASVLGPTASAAQRALKQAAAAASNRRLQPQTRQEAQLELDILASAAALATASSLEANSDTRRGTVAATSMTPASIANTMAVGRVVATLEIQTSKKISRSFTNSPAGDIQTSKKISRSFTNSPAGDDLSILVKDRNGENTKAKQGGGGGGGVPRNPYGGQRSNTNGGGGGGRTDTKKNNAEDEAQQRQSLEQIFLDLMRAEKRTGTKIYNHPPPPELVSSSSTVSTSTFPILPSSNRPPRSRQQHHNHHKNASPASSKTTTATRSTASQSSNSPNNRRRRSSSATRATMTTSGGLTGGPADTAVTPDNQSKQGQQRQGTMVRSASSPSLSSQGQSPESSAKEAFLHATKGPLLSTDSATIPWADGPMAEAEVRYQIPSMPLESEQPRPVTVDKRVSEQEQSASQAPTLGTSQAPTLGTTFTEKLQDAAALESYSEESLTSIDQKELDTSILTAFLDYVGAEKDEVANKTFVKDNKSNRNIKFPDDDDFEDAARSIQSESTTSLVVCAVPGRGSLSGNAQSFCVLNSISEALEGISGEGVPLELALMRDRCVDQCDRIPCIHSSPFMSRDGDTDDIRHSTTVLSASESFTTRDSSLGVVLPREEQAPLLDFYFFEELCKEMAEMELEEISKIPFTAVRRTNVGGVNRSMNQADSGVDRSDTLSPDTTTSRASTTLHQFKNEFPRLYDRLVLLFGMDRLKKLASGKFQKDTAKKLIEELLDSTKNSSDAAGVGAAAETNSSRDWLLDMGSTASSPAADEDQQQQAVKAIPKLSPPRKSTGNGFSRSALATMPALPITPSALAPSAMAVFQTPSSNGVAGERPVSPPNLNRTATIEVPPVPPSPATTGSSGSGPSPKRPLPDVSPEESLAPLSPRRSHGSCPTTASPLNALMDGSFREGCDEEDPVELLVPERRHFLDDLALPSMKDRTKMNLQSKALLANLAAARIKNELWSKNPPPEESPLPEQRPHHQESPNDAPEPSLNNSSRSTKQRRFLRNFALLPGGQKRLQAAIHDDAEDNVIMAARKARALRNPLKATKSTDAEVTEEVWGPTEALETNTDTFKGGKSVKRRKGLRRAFMKSEKSHAQDSVSLLVKQPLPEDGGDKASEVGTVGWEDFDPCKNETPLQRSPTPATDRQDPPGERAMTDKRVDSLPTTVSSLLYGESHPKFAEFGPVEYTRGDMEYDVVGREITVISSD